MHECHTPALRGRGLELRDAHVRRHTIANTVLVTFTDANLAKFAVSWARNLHSLGLPSLVGIAVRLGAAAERDLHRANSGLFCADSYLTRLNSAAGRWADLVPLLNFGVDVLCSDADVGWLQSPLPYLRAAVDAHPRAELFLASDRASAQGWTTRALPGGGASHLDLEDAHVHRTPSLNTGIVVLRASTAANATLRAMLEAWASATHHSDKQSQPKSVKTRCEQKRIGNGASFCVTTWSQGPINDLVLKRGGGPRLEADQRLAKVWGGRVVLGVLPGLQFTTALSYFVVARRGAASKAPVICVHAIFSHGRDSLRKVYILREAMTWHDDEAYYEGRSTGGRFLRFEPSVPARLQDEGGFALVEYQVQQFHAAARLSRLLNRTIVLPRLRCGDRTLAFPCFAWFHRPMVLRPMFSAPSPNSSSSKMPMPRDCPLYYWLDLHQVETLLPVRETSFLANPRTPSAIAESEATLTLCSGDATCAAAAGGKGRGALKSTTVEHPGRTTPAALAAALQHVETARLLSVRRVDRLELRSTEAGELWHPEGWISSPRTPSKKKEEATDLIVAATRHIYGWCSSCSVPGKVVTIGSINASTRRTLENFCRTEARGQLGRAGGALSCCDKATHRCGACATTEAAARRRYADGRTEWPDTAWLPTLASLRIPAEFADAPRCTHKLCVWDDLKYAPPE